MIMVSKYMRFYSAEDTKDILYYAYHLEDYKLNINVLDDNTNSFALVGLGFLIK